MYRLWVSLRLLNPSFYHRIPNMISELLEEEVTGIKPIHSELISLVRKSSKAMLERICCILDNAELEQNNNFETLIFDNPFPVLKSVIDKHHVC